MKSITVGIFDCSVSCFSFAIVPLDVNMRCYGISNHQPFGYLFISLLRLATKKIIKGLHYWPFVGGIHWSIVDSFQQIDYLHKGISTSWHDLSPHISWPYMPHVHAFWAVISVLMKSHGRMPPIKLGAMGGHTHSPIIYLQVCLESTTSCGYLCFVPFIPWLELSGFLFELW